jgi:hypothetical protein
LTLIKVDPDGWIGGGNMYTYVYNNPNVFIDRYGNVPDPSIPVQVFIDLITESIAPGVKRIGLCRAVQIDQRQNQNSRGQVKKKGSFPYYDVNIPASTLPHTWVIPQGWEDAHYQVLKRDKKTCKCYAQVWIWVPEEGGDSEREWVWFRLVIKVAAKHKCVVECPYGW